MNKVIYKDIIIIGAGVAGMTAALNCVRGGKSILILEKETYGGQIATSPRVENFPSIKAISGSELVDNMFEQITALGVEFELEDVQKIEKKDDFFFLETDYNHYKARCVIIATGVKQRKINVPHEDELLGKGVSYCAVCDGAFYKGEDVALIGDGNTALQYGILLSNYCHKVYVCTLFDKFFGEHSLIQSLKEKSNVEIIHNLSLKSFKYTDKLTGLTFENTTDNSELSLDVKGAFIAIGQIPDNEKWASLCELTSDGYIITNESCETKTKGLYAVGDCRDKKVRQLATAIADGSISAVYATLYIDSLK